MLKLHTTNYKLQTTNYKLQTTDVRLQNTKYKLQLGIVKAPPLVQGLALGSVGHVSVTAALTTGGHIAAADAASIAYFLLGVTRCLVLQLAQSIDSLIMSNRLVRADDTEGAGDTA